MSIFVSERAPHCSTCATSRLPLLFQRHPDDLGAASGCAEAARQGAQAHRNALALPRGCGPRPLPSRWPHGQGCSKPPQTLAPCARPLALYHHQHAPPPHYCTQLSAPATHHPVALVPAVAWPRARASGAAAILMPQPRNPSDNHRAKLRRAPHATCREGHRVGHPVLPCSQGTPLPPAFPTVERRASGCTLVAETLTHA